MEAVDVEVEVVLVVTEVTEVAAVVVTRLGGVAILRAMPVEAGHTSPEVAVVEMAAGLGAFKEVLVVPDVAAVLTVDVETSAAAVVVAVVGVDSNQAAAEIRLSSATMALSLRLIKMSRRWNNRSSTSRHRRCRSSSPQWANLR